MSSSRFPFATGRSGLPRSLKGTLFIPGQRPYHTVVQRPLSWMFAEAGEALTRRLRVGTFKSMLRQEIGWFDEASNSTGALTNRLANDASQVQGAAGTQIGTILQCIVAIVGAIALAFVYGWELTLITLVFFPLLLLGGVMQMRLMRGNVGSAKEALNDAGKVATEAIQNMRTVASLCKEKEFEIAYAERLKGLLQNLYRKASALGIIYSFSQAVTHFSLSAIFAFGAEMIEDDKMDAGDVFKVFSLITFCGIFLGQASAFGPDIGKAKAATRRIFFLIKRQPAIDGESTAGLCLDGSSYQSDVKFKDARFHYHIRPDVKVLQGLNFKVNEGHTVALVGSSGCGKSTCIALLERFYDLHQGSVAVDGHDVQSLNIRWLRSQIGLVSQEPVLFDCSIRENIEYGDNSRQISMDDIIRVAKEANIHNFISGLPQGYETNVGGKGTQLSGGQKQRIAIARALIRNPKILLLDEATSALDTESEKIVQEALDKARAGRTCITIAHRLSTIRDADKIVVIDMGRLVEEGTHEELFKLKGFYYRLLQAQSKR